MSSPWSIGRSQVWILGGPSTMVFRLLVRYCWLCSTACPAEMIVLLGSLYKDWFKGPTTLLQKSRGQTGPKWCGLFAVNHGGGCYSYVLAITKRRGRELCFNSQQIFGWQLYIHLHWVFEKTSVTSAKREQCDTMQFWEDSNCSFFLSSD